MSHYLQYQQHHQQQSPQTQQTMPYYNNLATLNMSSVQQQQQQQHCKLGNQTSIDIGYSSNYLGVSPSQQVTVNNSSNSPSLISIRRDSGFANSSLDELTMSIMSSNKVARPSEHDIQSLNNINNNNPSFLLSPTTPTSTTSEFEGSAPAVPSLSNGMDYMLNNVQHMLFAQQQQQQQPSSPSQMTTFPPSIYDMQQQQQQHQSVVTSQQLPVQQTLMSPLQYHPRHGQIQRPRQRKPQLQIMTESDIGQQIPMTVSNGNVIIANYSTPSVNWEPCEMNQPSAPVTSPSMSAASNIIQAGQQGYSWGFVSSPIESSFSSDSSSPFASPSSSYAHSDLPASCESSRAASPSFNNSSMYDLYLSERRFKRTNSDGSSSLIIRSRKSSTSSTSSMGSQRRTSNLRESSACSMSASPSSPRTSSTSHTHQCPKCGQCFAGPAVLVRHLESIHDKLLWNCVGCKSNLSRRDAVTRHINLSPMDSICRAVGTIGQVKTSNGIEVHYEVSSYRAKPLDEVMSRMGKKISNALRKEIDRSKAATRTKEITAASAASGFSTVNPANMNGMPEVSAMAMTNVPGGCLSSSIGGDLEMQSDCEEFLEDGSSKKRRRSLFPDEITAGRKKK